MSGRVEFLPLLYDVPGYNTEVKLWLPNIFSTDVCWRRLLKWFCQSIGAIRWYFASATPLQFLFNLFETSQMFWSWYEDVRVVWTLSSNYFLKLISTCELISDALSGYIVRATPTSILFQSFWNFANVLFLVWRCACGLDIIIKLILLPFYYTCELNHFSASRTQWVCTFTLVCRNTGAA